MSHILFNVSHIGLYIGVFVGICDTYGRTTLDIEGLLLQIIKSIAKMGIVDQIIKLYIYIYIYLWRSIIVIVLFTVLPLYFHISRKLD